MAKTGKPKEAPRALVLAYSKNDSVKNRGRGVYEVAKTSGALYGRLMNDLEGPSYPLAHSRPFWLQKGTRFKHPDGSLSTVVGYGWSPSEGICATIQNNKNPKEQDTISISVLCALPFDVVWEREW